MALCIHHCYLCGHLQSKELKSQNHRLLDVEGSSAYGRQVVPLNSYEQLLLPVIVILIGCVSHCLENGYGIKIFGSPWGQETPQLSLTWVAKIGWKPKCLEWAQGLLFRFLCITWTIQHMEHLGIVTRLSLKIILLPCFIVSFVLREPKYCLDQLPLSHAMKHHWHRLWNEEKYVKFPEALPRESCLF